eukprot:TRINITY_DN10886_c0_g1_i1.p1 TRINITY_DN10886_c0_g1~~TRINITY_DN10886_c0_g1_i1.p1  ORF type:complete len:459 (+),score=48.04 TRINITY_DN10886_c0_g1_i1:93-1469(+)
MSRLLMRCALGCGTAVATFGATVGLAAEERRSKPLRAVIVGGGCAGSTLAQSIEHILDTTLIDRKQYFEFTPALKDHLLSKPPEGFDPKVLSDDDKNYFRKNFIAHKYYLRYTNVVVSEAREVTPTHVILQDGRRIPYDRCFICTGSRQPAPWRQSTCVTVPERATEMARFRDLISKSMNIAIIGGGASGCEYASQLANEYPDKKISLYHSRQSLIPAHGKRINHFVNRYLLRRRATVNRMSRVTNVTFDEKTKKFAVEWKATNDEGFIIDDRVGGTDHDFDFVFDCRGIVPATQVLEKHFGSSLNDEGFALVDAANRLIGHRNVFALGDIALHDGPQGKESGLAFIVDDVLRVSSRYLHAASGGSFGKIPYSTNKLYDTVYPTQFIKLDSKTQVGHAGGSGQLTTWGNWVAKRAQNEFLSLYDAPAFRTKLRGGQLFQMRRILESAEEVELINEKKK